MNNLWIHPSLILICGAVLLPLIPKSLKKAFLLFVPLAAFAVVLSMLGQPDALHGQIDFLRWTLTFGRVDKLSLVSASIEKPNKKSRLSVARFRFSLDEATPGLDAWEALRSHPQVLALAAHVLGAPARVRDLHGRDPLPGFGLQGLHADAKPRTPGEGFSVSTAIWMIDDFTAENGATRIVPGSHRWIRPPTRELAQPQAHHADERIITGKAGSVLLFNGHLWHAGTQNLTAGSRRAGQMVMVRA